MHRPTLDDLYDPIVNVFLSRPKLEVLYNPLLDDSEHAKVYNPLLDDWVCVKVNLKVLV